jgi:hypothetical protein
MILPERHARLVAEAHAEVAEAHAAGRQGRSGQCAGGSARPPVRRPQRPYRSAWQPSITVARLI